jgi:hypothetical protein
MKYLLFFCVLVLLLLTICFGIYAFHYQDSVWSGYIGAGLGGLFTLLLAGVAYYELSRIRLTTSAEFSQRLKEDLLKPESRILTDLVAFKFIRYKDLKEECYEQDQKGDAKPDVQTGTGEQDKRKLHKESYFEVEVKDIHQCLPNEIAERLTEKKFYSEYEMSDLVLFHLENIGLFEEKGLIDIEMVYELFSYYIEFAYENCEIKKYIQAARSEPHNDDAWRKFEYIYHKCKCFQRAKERNKAIWLWKIRYTLGSWVMACR